MQLIELVLFDVSVPGLGFNSKTPQVRMKLLKKQLRQIAGPLLTLRLTTVKFD